MAHGAGGKATQTLIEGLLVPAFGSPALGRARRRGAAVGRAASELALTTDSFVVKPIRFPGGSIGELAVNGTVNDLAVAGAAPAGAQPRAGARGGPGADELRAEVEAIAAAAARGRRVEIVAGDTKVVERGHADAMYVCTTGVGTRRPARERCRRARSAGRPGARVGPDRRARHGDHAGPRRARARRRDRVRHPLAVAGGGRAARGGRAGAALHARRDPRRGRVGAQRAGARLAASRCTCARPTCRCSPEVAGAAELSGIDPMYVANEGVLVAFVAPEAADAALAALRSVPGCEAAAEIGEVQDGAAGDGAGARRRSAAGG